ncbi:MAG: endopeptidase La [Alphaproteobacteria bacterium]|jgi:ATP-dependent Lon protease|uniref:Lon protease n=3 Tax=Brevundimonas TaxID=41275 RepID=A0A6G7EL35_9CAUL|nr:MULTISPECIES: endopeptidase La [Brevundimonas]MBU4196915.1 endopeptidase La [Alphaproteobacteria bacterium]OGN47256.1 MAG: endopeptidase La [Caulobacterales bacterium GWE1_67_11]OGN48254.1 MAG: endopeptidase La [Caulobacterales bacterium RIFCSPHIGHO2_12_FULL_68_13]EDX80937.1 ATP-dependent protease La [Brevundimonas sp. BAL3]MBA4332128.1 endopeptidase La [Brevundimonas sp.]
MTETKILPVLPLRDIVVFPHMVVPLFVGREKSVKALDEIMKGEKQILLATQKNSVDDDPSPDAIYPIGVLASVLQLLKLPDGTVKVLVEGKGRARLTRFTDREDYFEAEAVEIEDEPGDASQTEAMLRAVVEQFENYVKLNKKVPPEALSSIPQITDASKLADSVAAHLSVKIIDKQGLLETFDVPKRLEKVYGLMEGEISVLQVEKKIRSRVKRQMEKTQREYYLNEQMKAIQRELGETDDARDEIMDLEKRIRKTRLSKEARAKAEAEVKKLRNMSPMSAESTVVRNYLDWLLSVPWGKAKQKPIDLVKAEEILEEDHFGLEKVKERIIEYLAVQARTGSLKGPILCLVGPPGVGKTSLAKSIAKATGREYVRMSLGGVRDESEIRGHRRTYIGSMPGKIIQSMKKAKTTNAFVLLDEIDKLGSDWRGDPSSALLEVLDPAQNSTFGDHYLEVDYDLSQVMFVTTANSLNMPQPLMDRMEIIRVSGYTEDEKVEIAKRHVLPKQLTDHGLKADELIVPEDTIRDLIRYYTREAGVRSLERALGGLARKAVREMAKTKVTSITVDAEKLAEYAGVRKFRYGETDEEDQVGIVTGLAWTEFGGDILTIEAIKMPGRGRMTVTGNLKDVMKESISAAASYVRSRALAFGVKPPVFEKTDIHVHVPDGATPKDGPSAGAAMTVAMVSVLTGIPIRKDIAMTGEITLRGRVTAIGGLKEKLLAALRSGVKTVLIPQENEKDLADVPDNVKSALEIVPISTADEALHWALTGPLTPVEWDEATDPLPAPVPPLDGAAATVSH